MQQERSLKPLEIRQLSFLKCNFKRKRGGGGKICVACVVKWEMEQNKTNTHWLYLEYSLEMELIHALPPGRIRFPPGGR